MNRMDRRIRFINQTNPKQISLAGTEGGGTPSFNSLASVGRKSLRLADSHNDLSMIEFSGLSDAIGNASEVIKAQADFVTDTNMNDGVMKAVEEFVLK